jgi:hypothetical protein
MSKFRIAYGVLAHQTSFQRQCQRFRERQLSQTSLTVPSPRKPDTGTLEAEPRPARISGARTQLKKLR